MNTIELSISPAYCSNWTIAMALREFIANAMDSGDPDWMLSHNSQSLVIANKGTIPTSALLMGTSIKDSDDAIGQFGEGFKVAIVVLLQRGCTIRIQNGGQNWDFTIAHSSVFEAECLQVQMYDLPNASDFVSCIISYPEDLRNEIAFGLEALMPELTSTYILGDVAILEQQGIYVKGLHVAKPNFKFGYDFHPNAITLNRDRTHFDQDAASKVICQAIEDHGTEADWNNLVQMVYSNLFEGATDDFRYLTWYPEEFPRLQESLIALARKHAEGRPLADHRTQSSGYHLSYGLSAVVRGGAYGTANKHLFAEVEQLQWHKELTALVAKHRNSLRRDTRQALEQLLEKHRKTN